MIEVLAQLKKLLTARNLHYLDTILIMLTDPSNNQIYDVFWTRFRQRYPQDGAVQEAWRGLHTLHQIVKQQMKE